MALTDGEIVFVLSNNVIAKTFVYKPGLGHPETIALFNKLAGSTYFTSILMYNDKARFL